MKRVISLLLAVLLSVSVLAGCKEASTGGEAALSEAQISEKLQTDFASSAKIKYKGIEAEAQIKKEGGGCTVDFTAPENLAGMQFDISVEKDVVEIVSNQQSFQFSLRLDGESGNILNLQIPDEELDISFENFTFLQ